MLLPSIRPGANHSPAISYIILRNSIVFNFGIQKSGSGSSIEFAMKLAPKIAPCRGIPPDINHLSSSILIKDHFPDLFFPDIPCLQNKTSIQGAVVMYTCFIRVLFPSFNIIIIHLLVDVLILLLPRISLATAV